MISFDVKPSQTHNALMNSANRDAGYKQTNIEHDALLEKYVSPGMGPESMALARKMGEEAEKQDPKYWDNDTKPRKDLALGSSFIEKIDYYPSLQTAIITMNGKPYNFYGFSPDEIGDMVTSPSLGKYIWDNDRFISKHRK